MKPFNDETTDGNERAIKRGRHVPDGAINLSWAKNPELTPQNNIIMLDTSRITPQNTENDIFVRKLMYANAVGALQDEFGNEIVEEQYPYVSDVFSVDEDFVALPGSEYEPEDILPFVHISRFFHVDFAGLTLGTALQTYHSEKIKVIDSNGKEYVDENDKPRYRVTICPALNNTSSSSFQGVYRLFVFVDEVDNEDLYLTYNKVELDIHGIMKNQDISHQEILNPESYFQYVPEEADVVDPANRKQKIYSTKPVHALNDHVELTRNDADGYKVYVPRKASPDPRLFQLFRWRVNCTFTHAFKVDPLTEVKAINCGVIRTNGIKSICPYSFLNLWKSEHNISSVDFVNPMKPPAHLLEKEEAKYWEVNIDTVSLEDLEKFDILIWSPAIMWFDYTPYLNKIRYFTETVGGTLMIDTCNYSAPTFTSLGIRCSAPTDPFTGEPHITGPSSETVSPRDSIFDTDHKLFDGNDQLGGWNFNDEDSHYNYESFSLYTTEHSQFYQSQIQFIREYPSDYKVLVDAPLSVEEATPTNKAEVILKEINGGGSLMFLTTAVLVSTSSIFSAESGYMTALNRGDKRPSSRFYYRDVNSYVIQGAYKFLYNTCMMAVSKKLLDSSDDTSFSTTWSKPSKWRASWVINADNNILSDIEKSLYSFAQLPTPPPDDPVPVWQRQLSPKTLKQLVYDELSPEQIIQMSGATRTYSIEITNNLVNVQTEGLDDSNLVYAWTSAFTPPFEVPIELGPHVVREEPTQGEYESAQFIQKEYPAKPYGLQLQATFTKSADIFVTEDVNWTAHGTATKNVYVPPRTVAATRDTSLSWREFGSNHVDQSGDLYEFGVPSPYGIRTWQNSNYWTSAWGPGNLNWPHFGFAVRLTTGSSGEAVQFVQYALNKMQEYGFIDMGGYLAIDGYYGNRTSGGVYAMQGTFNARYYDGVVDAESWSIIGNQMLRLIYQFGVLPNPNDISRFLYNVLAYVQRTSISDGSDSGYLKRSWVTNGPSIIWEMFGVMFNEVHNIHGVTVVPFLTGATDNLMFRSIHITTLNSPADLPGRMYNYDSRSGQLIYMPLRPRNGDSCYVPVGPYAGNTVIVGIGQDQGSGWGTARELGVKDIVAHAVVNTTTTTPGRVEATDISISDTGFAKCRSNVDVIQKATYKNQGYKGWLTNVVWKTITDDNKNVATGIYPNGVVVCRNNIVHTDESGEHFTFGPNIPGTQVYYAMNTDRQILPGHETGFASKSEGVKLLCDENGKPIGFPDLPTDMNNADSNVERHYGVFTLTSTKSDHSIRYGFYDVRTQEFLGTKTAHPEISYLEYMTRGPDNVFIAVYSDFEVLRHHKLPPADDAPLIPFRWAMPVYGVCYRSTSRVGLEPLPDNLDITDVWPVPVRVGKFIRAVQIRSRTKNPLTTYIKDYEDTIVRGFYALPEVWNAPWSQLYGRPYSDVTGEHPIIEDDQVIRVRQAPILMVKEPAANPTEADPLRPALKVYKRDSLQSEWEELSLTMIDDYNVSNGLIYLNEAITSADPMLLKVDYTSARRTYYFKYVGDDRINLNPYLPSIKEFLNQSIYIYMLPRWVRDKDGNIITDSVEGHTLRFTIDPGVFNPRDPDYDPMAVQLGIIHVTTNLDIDKLVMLDTRTRGGGAKEGLNVPELSKLINDAKSYWDMGAGTGITYQRSGFVVIRLPEELKDQFPEENDIRKLIRRNLTAGVEFKIETLEGEPW